MADYTDIRADLVSHVSWAPGGDQLLVAATPSPAAPARLMLYRSDLWKVHHSWTLQVEPETLTSSWANDGTRIAVTWAGRGLIELATADEQPVRERPVDGMVMHIAWRPNHDVIAGVGFSPRGIPEIHMWVAGDVSAPALRKPLADSPGGTFSWCGWSRSGDSLALLFARQLDASFTRFDNELLIFSVDQQDQLTLTKRIALPSGPIEIDNSSELWSPAGDAFAIPVQDDSGRGLGFVDVATASVTEIWRPSNDGDSGLTGVAWSPTGALVAATNRTHIFVLDSKSRALRYTLDSQHPLSDPRWIMGGGQSNELQQEVSISGFTNAIAWSPVGPHVVAGNNGALRVFSIPSGQ